MKASHDTRWKKKLKKRGNEGVQSHQLCSMAGCTCSRNEGSQRLANRFVHDERNLLRKTLRDAEVTYKGSVRTNIRRPAEQRTLRLREKLRSLQKKQEKERKRRAKNALLVPSMVSSLSLIKKYARERKAKQVKYRNLYRVFGR